MSKELEQPLFSQEDLEPWRREWKGIPEFIQEDLEPWRSVLVHFASRGDMENFARLVEQTLTPKTQSLWYPAAEIGHYANKRYADEP